MRGKAFTRSIFDESGWLSDYALPADRELEHALARTLQHYRMLRRMWLDEPSHADVRETLRRLARMTPAEAAERWAALDSSVTAEIDLQHHIQNGEGVPHSHIHGCPENLPSLAKNAMDRLEEERLKGGRRPTAHFSVLLAADLAAHWWRMKGTAPTVRITDFDGTDFQQWAKAMFERVGYATGDIYKHLRDGVRAAKEEGRIPA